MLSSETHNPGTRRVGLVADGEAALVDGAAAPVLNLTMTSSPVCKSPDVTAVDWPSEIPNVTGTALSFPASRTYTCCLPAGEAESPICLSTAADGCRRNTAFGTLKVSSSFVVRMRASAVIPGNSLRSGLETVMTTSYVTTFCVMIGALRTSATWPWNVIAG